MANTLSALNPAFWAKKMQEVRHKDLVALALCNTELRSELQHGDTVHKPYRSRLSPQDYTRGTAVSIKDVGATDESLVVDTAKINPFYIDDLDKIQNGYDTAMEFASDAMKDLNELVDADVLSEYANANSSVTNLDVGGASAVAIPVSTGNVQRIFTAASRKLDNKKIKQDGRFAVIGPSMLEQLRLYIGGQDTAFGADVGNNGTIGSRFGFALYLSINLTWTGSLTLATQPTDADTVVINGVTFTFKTTLGSTAGNVLIGGSAAAAQANLKALVNAPGTTTAQGVALSAADQVLMAGITAGTVASNVLPFIGEGKGEMTVSETLTAAADIWSLQTTHALFGRKGAIDLVMQAMPQVEFKDVPDKLGKNVLPWMLYGKKTFNANRDELVDVKIDASGY